MLYQEIPVKIEYMNEMTPEDKDQEKLPVLIKRDSGPPEVHHISKRDRDVVDSFISTGALGITAKELKMKRDDVKDILSRPELQRYIAERFKRAADRYDLTEDKIMSKLNMVLESDGKVKYDASFTKALELGAKILKLIQPQSINLGVQVNNNPYKTLSDEDLDRVIQERIRGTKTPNET